MHQSVGNIPRTLLHGDPPKNVSKANAMVDEALSIAQHAMRTSVHTTLGSSPGALVFSRDMFLNVLVQQLACYNSKERTPSQL